MGVAIGISSRLPPFMVVVTMSDEHNIRVEMKNTLVISPVAVHAPEMCEAANKDGFYNTKLNSPLNQSSPGYAHYLGNFNTTTGTDKAGYVLHVGTLGPATRNETTAHTSSTLQGLDFRH